jgi:hypothetical protein
MLPEAKTDFPKCLYLDQNKWIDLARAHYEKPVGEQFKPCLEAVRAAITSGKLLVPFSVTNAIESMITRDEGRRKRLAEFMVDLSGNKSMLPESAIAPTEITNAVRKLFGATATEIPRRSLVQTGILHATGMEQEFRGMLPPPFGAGFAAFMNTPEKTVEFLMGLGSKRDHIDTARAGEAGARDIFEADRTAFASMGLAERLQVELYGLFDKNSKYRAALKAALVTLGRTVAEFKSEMENDEKLAEFIASIPNFDVFITLRIERERDKERKVEHNDIRDIDWLSVAVPYSIVVVSERYWGGKIAAAGLAANYDTVLLNNLQDLPTQLSAMGCLG